METKSVILAGATGLVGTEIMKILIDHEQFDPITVLTRRPIPDHNSIIQLQVDFDHLSTHKELIRGDVVIIALGSTLTKAGSKEAFYKVDYTYCYEVARLAKENNAHRILLISSMGADENSRIFYSRVKGELETAVQKLQYPVVSIFRPSLILGNRQEFRLREEIGKIFGGLFSFLIPAKFKPIHARTIARAIVNTAIEDIHGFRVFESDEIRKIGKN